MTINLGSAAAVMNIKPSSLVPISNSRTTVGSMFERAFAPQSREAADRNEYRSFKGGEEKKMPAIKRSPKEVQDQAHSNDKVASATVTVPTTTSSLPGSVAEAATTNHASSKKQLGEEYVAALKQYLNTSSQSGQVSSVIPMFFQEAVKHEEEAVKQEGLEVVENDQIAVRTVKHIPTSSPRDQYYLDLAVQYLPHFKPPVDYISSTPLPKRRKKAAWPMDSLPDANGFCSGMSRSLCPSSDGGSSPCSSDYNSSSSEEETSKTD